MSIQYVNEATIILIINISVRVSSWKTGMTVYQLSFILVRTQQKTTHLQQNRNKPAYKHKIKRADLTHEL